MMIRSADYQTPSLRVGLGGILALHFLLILQPVSLNDEEFSLKVISPELFWSFLYFFFFKPQLFSQLMAGSLPSSETMSEVGCVCLGA